MAKNHYLKSGELLLIFTEGRQFAVREKDARYQKVMEALLKDDYAAVKKVMTQVSTKVNDMMAEIKKTFETLEVQITPNSILIDGIEIKGFLVSRIKDLIEKNLPTDHLISFLKRAFLNPRRFVLEELFDWLDANDMPVTDDGCFLGYKKLDSEFKDRYTHTIDNRPGQHVVFPMERRVEIVDRSHACGSHAFHVAAFDYLGGFGSASEPVVVVKVDPQHVFSFPGSRTGSEAKLQCLEYDVLECINLNTERIPAKNALDKNKVDANPAPKVPEKHHVEPGQAISFDSIDSLNKRFSFTVKVGYSLLLFKLSKGDICVTPSKILELAARQNPGIKDLVKHLGDQLAVSDLSNNLTTGNTFKEDKYICLVNDQFSKKTWRLKVFNDGKKYDLFEVRL